ncbi:spermidine/putrescine ABC transporter ATPase subunit [Caballeronia arvi]|uniref:Spermidine/putrescine import ATP-binding protein PotA n=1 Tax=Caballeronia arvi TaxID=1777135 RepID=A0A158IS80_9BURK|nr:ABC transporter ATP-binding protein [Caballeronia arvi]SAL58891.1 spermidine/putrescine ABC transporter ATPase subunit [Caballeronia arvi]
MNNILLSVQKINKSFGHSKALTDVSIDVRCGEFVAMLGPSGCGKTTLLRCISGFVTPDNGTISIGGVDITRVAPNRRPLNTVFQNYALFPHMTVLENVSYGPRRAGTPKAEARERAAEALAMVGLGEHGERLPAQMSGGQQQRVALARALVNRPKLLLLDEPLSALDLKLRKRMQIELKQLQEKLGIAFVFVTHDQEEAMAMADRIIVMSGGHVEQIGSGNEIYRKPATRFVADFIGDANFVSCTPAGNGTLRPSLGSEVIEHVQTRGAERFTAILRPEHISLMREEAPGMSMSAGVVEDVIDIGMLSTVLVRVGEQIVTCRRINDQATLTRGDAVKLGFRPRDLHVVEE